MPSSKEERKKYFKDKTSIILTRENRNRLMEIKVGLDFNNVNQVITYLLEKNAFYGEEE